LGVKLTATVMPSGKTVRIQPQAVDREDARTKLHFPRKFGEDTCNVLEQAGYAESEIASLAQNGIVALQVGSRGAR
jgi:hypothetical protein